MSTTKRTCHASSPLYNNNSAYIKKKTVVLLLFYAMYDKGHLDDQPQAVRIYKAIYI